MDEAGTKLKRLRERLGLRVRDVEEFSQALAERHRNQEFFVAISRLADIENKGVVPSIFKLYSLCVIYRLDLAEALRWYGVDVNGLTADAGQIPLPQTHSVGLGRSPFPGLDGGEIQVPLSLDPGVDLRKTTFLSRTIQRWGKLPLMLVDGFDPKSFRYGFIGLEDHFMYPLLSPGSLVLIDDTKRKVISSGWRTEYQRPIYFLEKRDGWMCAWCSVEGTRMIVQPHPASPESPRVLELGTEVDIVGQVVGVAMRLDPEAPHRTGS